MRLLSINIINTHLSENYAVISSCVVYQTSFFCICSFYPWHARHRLCDGSSRMLPRNPFFGIKQILCCYQGSRHDKKADVGT